MPVGTAVDGNCVRRINKTDANTPPLPPPRRAQPNAAPVHAGVSGQHRCAVWMLQRVTESNGQSNQAHMLEVDTGDTGVKRSFIPFFCVFFRG